MKDSAFSLLRGAPGTSVSRQRARGLLTLTISLVALLILLTPTRIVLSQTATTSRISGTVTDSNKAVLPGVEVELSDPATNQRWKQTTDDSGKYVFATVAPGVYNITVTKQGFRTTNFASVKVEVAKSYDFDTVLEVGEVKEIVQVSAGAGGDLQKTDSTVGNVISGAIMPRFPALTRTANELLTVQPLVTPDGSVAGSRSDQSTFLLDGIDITNQSVGGLGTYARLPIDGIEEFRVGVANPTAAFGRGAGGQVSVISRHGTNDYHGAAYWYHQNDNLNAHDWTSKRLGRRADGTEVVRKAELKDNRFGFRFGGPIYPWEDKAFVFLNYEGRRFPRSTPLVRVVPTDTLRAGILRFRDASGSIVSYNLANSALCGAAGNQQCDPRGLGLSPTISSLFSKLPQGNDSTQGDGLNTIGFRGNVGNPLTNDYYNARVDYNISSNWRFDAAFRYFGELNGLATPASIVGGNLQSLGKSPNRQNMISAGVIGTFTPNLTGEFRFGWVRIRTAQDVTRPDASAAILGIPGTESGITDGQTNIALDLGARGGFNSLLSEPIDVDTQVARKQANDNKNFQYNADMTWVKGDHTFQFGSHLRYLPTRHFRDDKVLGALGALVAQLDSDLGAVAIPATSRPPTCSATITKNCLTAADVSNFNRFFASATGIIDNVSVLAVRDGELKPLPFGQLLEADTTLWAPEFYFQDVWRIRPSLTLTFGLNYGWQTPPTEKLGRQSVQIDGQTLKVQTAREYLRAKEQAARAGNIFNPPIAFQPIKESGRSGVFDTDWNNIGPRVAAAWNPSFKNKYLNALFGDRKTVIRGGYSLVFDRQNTVQSVIIPTLGVAFAQTLNVSAPLCNSTGSGGAGCNGTSTNPALSGFRVGVDGKIPIPTVPTLGMPISPFWGIRPGAVGPPFTAAGDLILDPEILSFQVDPTIEVGENHAIDLTWQRELKGNMLLEAGYVGRFARKLPQSMSFGQVPYMFLDKASNQTFAQAFDAVANQLRTGVLPANVTVQPWFENLYPALGATAGGTRALATSQQANFISGNISSIFQTIDVRRLRNGLQPFNNYVAQTLFLRASTGLSNYNGLFVTLHKRLSQGLLFTVNYTFSRSLDQLGAIQNAANVMPNSFDLNAEYGPSAFDITHLFNTSWLYDLPFGGRRFRSSFGPLNKVLEGWYLSGIFTAQSGDPLTVTENAFVWGGSRFLGFASGALSKVNPGTFGNSVNRGIPGTNNIGVTGNPGTGGSGLNLFGNPEEVYNQFRRVNISTDGRAGRANPLRGMGRWNLDTSIGKKTNITEKVNVVFSADFFNILNKVDFTNPGLSLTAPTSFGVITSQFVPANRTSGSRWIQLSFRVEF
ncbi:MAG: carboxypeptidase-like regulatory domain-containing protein [Acidobacteriota bacterium]